MATATRKRRTKKQETVDIPTVCNQLQIHKRNRDVAIKARITVFNQLAANVATTLGYWSNMEKDDREKKWEQVRELVQGLLKHGDIDHDDREEKVMILGLVVGAKPAIDAFDNLAKQHEKKMVPLVRQLPVCEWACSIRGVSELTIANIIGETGDLSKYSGPAKVWKRMGCAPYEKNGKVHTGKQWKVEGGLSKEDWEEFGYVGRRRSVIYNLTSCMKRSCCGKNTTAPGADNKYIERYLDMKSDKLELEWSDGHADNHGMLLMGKLFLKDLWKEWNK